VDAPALVDASGFVDAPTLVDAPTRPSPIPRRLRWAPSSSTGSARSTSACPSSARSRPGSNPRSRSIQPRRPARAPSPGSPRRTSPPTQRAWPLSDKSPPGERSPAIRPKPAPIRVRSPPHGG
jgi:hypothetical protein